jgi:hypothetical protein
LVIGKKTASVLTAFSSLVVPDLAWAAEEKTALASATFYGFIQVNGVYEASPSNSQSWASYLSVEPSDKGPRGGLYTTARLSRFGVKGQLSDPSINYLVEADFGGTTDTNVHSGPYTSFNLRHAYIQSSDWLVGQTYSNAYDVASVPETVENNAPLTSPGVRQTQLRWTQKVGERAAFSMALENPLPNITEKDKVTNGIGNLPDLTLRFHQPTAQGHVAAVALAHRYVFNNGSAERNATGGLIGLSGSHKHNNDTWLFGVYRGAGAGRYQWGAYKQGAFDDGKEIQTFKSTAYHLAYVHPWNDKTRSNLVYANMRFGDQPSSGGTTNNKALSQYQLNTFFTLARNVETGVELERGIRLGFDGTQSHERRLNMRVRATF